VTDDGDRHLSEDAQDLGVHPREVASDLGPSGVRKKSRSCLFRILGGGLILSASLGLLAVVYTRVQLFEDQSEPLNASGTELMITDQGATSSEPTSDNEEPTSDTEEPISGTWAMYWTNANGSESQAFTITFTGSDTGTLRDPQRRHRVQYHLQGERR
jgi:hypothetical protein